VSTVVGIDGAPSTPVEKVVDLGAVAGVAIGDEYQGGRTQTVSSSRIWGS
jgi:hypothetical protein